MHFKKFFAATVIVVLYGLQANADIILIVGNGLKFTYSQGDTATLPVFAYDSTSGSPVNLSDYGLAFRLGSTKDLPDGFTDFSVDFTGGLIPVAGAGSGIDIGAVNSLESDSGATAFNMFVNNSQANEAAAFSFSASNPTKLFDISFKVGSVADGVYQFQFIHDATSFGGLVNNATGSGYPEPFGFATGTNLNQFTITAVPEPTSLALLGIGFLGFFVRRWQGLRI